MNCPRCDSTRLVTHTATAAGTPRKRCKDCGKAFVVGKPKTPGPLPIGDKAMSSAERVRRFRERQKQ